MPQINKGFAKSKMNKDMDERVVASGEYRDALNIQISSSDASDVGTVQSLLGNTLVSAGIVPIGSKCVGSIAHNKEDKIYYFVAGPAYEHGYQEGVWKDYIIEYDIKRERFKYVFVDIYRVHLKTSAPSTNRDIPISSSSPSVKSVRRDMNINGYADDGSNTHIIYSNNEDLVEVISIGTPPNTINIYSSTVDYNSVSVPAGTLLKLKPEHQILRFNHIAANNGIITGINIIDDMLFWTDNFSEPKKINIKRSIAGTGGSVALPPPGNVFAGDSTEYHTRLCVTPDNNSALMVKPRTGTFPTGDPFYAEEENVTVIKKAPRKPPRLVMSQHEDGRDGDNTFSETDGTISNICGPPSTTENSFSYIVPGTSPALHKVKVEGGELKNVYVANPVHWKIGDMIIFNQEQDVNSAEGFTEHDVRATIVSVPSSVPSTGPYNFLIQSIDEQAIDEEQKVWNLRLEEKRPLFEYKFVRFAYRYKYEDGEYSTFSPWSEPAFLAGEYDYLPKKGYNLGMTNRLRQLKVTHYITEDMPRDVIQVDILYKDEKGPNIYTVESIIATDGWNEKGEKLWPDKLGYEAATGSSSNVLNTGVNAWRGEFEVTSELIHKTLPSNQLLRQWDNVPRVALAQEISGNRLVYGNYIQNFNITHHDTGTTEIRPLINVILSSKDAPLNAPEGTPNDPLNGEDTTEGFVLPGKTCRSLRTYQIGVVYGDEYGRETPVLAGKNASGSITIPVENSSTLNKLRVDIGSRAPSFAKYYKFFIKETSNEYYNLAMDRWYDAEDGNIWLSFASADRNKLDEEMHIVLKKKHDSHEPVTDPARYKVLAIENSAPDFIKTNIKSLGSAGGGSSDVGSSAIFPMEDYDQVWIKTGATGVSDWYNTSISEFNAKINAGTLFMRVRTTLIKSNWYQITKMKEGSGYYKFKSDKSFGEDMNFTSTNGTYSSRVSGLKVEISDHKVENKKEFEGRYFVKIYKDLVLINNLLQATEPEYKVINASRIGYWNLPKAGFTDIVGGDMVNWERVAVLNWGELDVGSSNCSDTSFSGNWAGNGGSGRADAFFFKTIAGWISECGGDSCAARDHTKKWMQKSEGLFHIDSSWVRGTKDCNGSSCSRSSLTKDCDKNNTRGKGVTNGGKSMDIGYVTAGNWSWKKAEDGEFISQLMKKGVNFRFREDPDGCVYTVTGTAGASSSDSHYGKHHTWHKTSSKGNGNNKYRWRLDFERVDLPGVGLGAGPAKYHPIGPRATTANPDVAELGFYGGRHGSYWWELTHSNGSHSNLRVPAPDGMLQGGTAVSQMKSGSTSYTNPITGLTTTGTQQAKYYRMHTAKYHHIEIVEPMEDEDGDWSSKNPAVWETEPKEDIGMDIYYEASPALPITIKAMTNESFAPYGSIVDRDYDPHFPPDIRVTSWSDNRVSVSGGVTIKGGDRIRFTRPDGFTSMAICNSIPGFPYPAMSTPVNNFTVRAFDQAPNFSNNHYSDAPHNQPAILSWYNAFAWGNGIESDRIRDDYNQVTIANGVKASTVMATPYKQERRKTGLIHSGIYNSQSGINSLNQFIQAEKITKDMNPTYGSIQKLYTNDGNIVAFHEDKVMKVLADKNALYNADGNKNVAISSNFLGSDSPYATEYGISTNPESFATDLTGRMYFSDRSRSAILRLSQSGIDNISDYGMKDWFDDHLNAHTTRILGTFDQKKGLYNVSISGAVQDAVAEVAEEVVVLDSGECNCDGEDKGNRSEDNPKFELFKKTLSFSENSKGWTSFKSFLPEGGLSINNEYYTFKNGNLYQHHSNKVRNNFYGEQFDSSISVLFNDDPAAVKSFATLNYEGSQARITASMTDHSYSNLNSKTGWYVESMITDLQECDNLEFVNKEGKWFSYVKGASTSLANLDENEFSVQGIGVVAEVSGAGPAPINCLTITPNALCDNILGCMDPSASNYNPNATHDDGQCEYPPQEVYGCMDANADNHDPNATVDDGSCTYPEPPSLDLGGLSFGINTPNKLKNGNGAVGFAGDLHMCAYPLEQGEDMYGAHCTRPGGNLTLNGSGNHTGAVYTESYYFELGTGSANNPPLNVGQSYKLSWHEIVLALKAHHVCSDCLMGGWGIRIDTGSGSPGNSELNSATVVYDPVASSDLTFADDGSGGTHDFRNAKCSKNDVNNANGWNTAGASEGSASRWNQKCATFVATATQHRVHFYAVTDFNLCTACNFASPTGNPHGTYVGITKVIFTPGNC